MTESARRDLTESEERRLARLARRGDERAFERLVESHLPLVHAIAREYRSLGLPSEELVSEGLLGLVKATRGFDPERGTRLASYAAWWIRAHIRRYTIDNRRIVRCPSSRAARKLLARMRGTERALAQQHGEWPGPEAVASALGVSARDVEEMRGVLGGRDVPCGVEIGGRSFEVPYSGPSPEAIVADAEERQAVSRVLQRALCQLDPRARHVLEQRTIAPETATLAMLSAELGVSRERVRQIEQQAKTRVRKLCA